MACPVVWEVAVKKLRFREPRGQGWRLLMLDGGYNDEHAVALTATLVYATYISTNQLRHEPGDTAQGLGQERIWCGIRKAGLQSRSLTKVLQQIWTR